MATDAKQFFTVKEVAQMLEVTPSLVRQSIYRGEVEAARIGQRLYISRKNLDDLLAFRRRERIGVHQSARKQLFKAGFVYSRGGNGPADRRGWWKDGTFIAPTAQEALGHWLKKEKDHSF